jgi:4-hydroxyproline epimerase
MIRNNVVVIDSHSGGEPTRVVIAGGPDLGHGDLAVQRERFRREHDGFRSAIINEPRGSQVLVGALLCRPTDPRCSAGVIFFNNVGYLGMCGHGTMGVAVTMAHVKKLRRGVHYLETPVGIVSFEYHGGNTVTVENVPSYRHAAGISVTGPVGTVRGDVAWGGNWFFLVGAHDQELTLANVDRLTEYAWQIRQALACAGVTGADGAEIDHIELFGPPVDQRADSRNFVLCPGKAYDRSPCGTGTSAKLACLCADGELAEGQTWRQEGILGTIFEGLILRRGAQLIPRITGTAYIQAEATLLFDPDDPFREGIRP